MADPYEYDVFLSHSSKDKLVVLDLAKRLKNDGLRVWLDDWVIEPGNPIFQKVQEGIRQSRVLLLFMSAQAFGSDWATLESQANLFLDPLNKAQRFIPLRLDDAAAPPFLRQYAYIDWRTPSDAEYARLLKLFVPPAASPSANARQTSSKPEDIPFGQRAHGSSPPDGGQPPGSSHHLGHISPVSSEIVDVPADTRQSLPPAKKPSVVITLHGIKTRGKWQKDLAPVLASAGFIPVPLDYGNFLAIQLLIPAARRKKIDWFRDEYERVCAQENVSRPSIIAHSFGTYLVARAMQIYDSVEFDRVILCGAIARQDYHWAGPFGKVQVHAVLNDFGRMDFWAGIVAWLVNDAGPSGSKGFTDLADGNVIQIDHQEFRHSDYFFRGNYEKSWLPFLRGEPQKVLPKTEPTPPNWRFRITLGVSVVFGVLACFFLLPLLPGLYPREQLTFEDVYNNLCPETGSLDPTALAPITKHLHEPVSWEGIVTRTVSGNGYVYTFNVKPVGAKDDQRPCKNVTIYPKDALDVVFFGTRPEGLKVKFQGEFATFNASGAGITKARVWKSK